MASILFPLIIIDLLELGQRLSQSITIFKTYLGKLIFLSNKELVITETELKAIARAAYTGVNNTPNVVYNTPAAIGIPKQL